MSEKLLHKHPYAVYFELSFRFIGSKFTKTTFLIAAFLELIQYFQKSYFSQHFWRAASGFFH